MNQARTARMAGATWPMAVPRSLVFAAGFVAAALIVQLWVGAYATDFGQTGDESAYFVTSLMIADFLRHHLLSNPLTFARSYYAHDPRVAIGHYPPMFMLTQALMFLLFGAKARLALVLQALVTGGCAGLAAELSARAAGVVAGIVAGTAVLLSPHILFLVDTDMADNFLALLVTLSAFSWAAYVRHRSWRPLLLFTVFASAAALTKGTALALALLPLIDAGLRRNGLALGPRTFLAAALAGLVLVPWYGLTYRMAAAGFHYHWGWAYSRLAVPYFSAALLFSVGVPLLLLFGCGLFFAGRTRPTPPAFDARPYAAAAIAMIVFPMLVPADLDARYMIPAIPSLVIVAIWGGFNLVRNAALRRRRLTAVLGAVAVLLSTASVYARPHVEPFGTQKLAAAWRHATSPNPLVLVAAGPLEEGATIASFAQLDNGQGAYVVRGSQLLARSNFMGAHYRARFSSPAAMARWIQQRHIGWLIVESAGTAGDPPHAIMLAAAIAQHLLHATARARSVSTRNHGETLTLYELPAATSRPSASDPVYRALKPSIHV